MEISGLYVIITKPALPYTKIAELCVRNGIKMLQLREKHFSDKQLLKIGREIKSITIGSQTKFVINDRPDIAVLCDADCLHLGQDDISVDDARKIVGENILIGLSTHSIQQAKDAMLKNPDYIGFGPIYATTTKVNPDPVVSTSLLKAVLSFANVPVVAIGGIFPENIRNVIDTGARTVCMVHYLMELEDFEDRLVKIKGILNNSQKIKT